jgi:hypothetical protein
MSERRSWSGFGYQISLARGLLRIIAWRIAIAGSQTTHILVDGNSQIPFESGTGAIDGQRHGKARSGRMAGGRQLL